MRFKGRFLSRWTLVPPKTFEALQCQIYSLKTKKRLDYAHAPSNQLIIKNLKYEKELYRNIVVPNLVHVL